jgi:hypothetical protein
MNTSLDDIIRMIELCLNTVQEQRKMDEAKIMSSYFDGCESAYKMLLEQLKKMKEMK